MMPDTASDKRAVTWSKSLVKKARMLRRAHVRACGDYGMSGPNSCASNGLAKIGTPVRLARSSSSA